MARGLLGFDRWTFRLVLLPRRAAFFTLAYTLWFGRPLMSQQRSVYRLCFVSMKSRDLPLKAGNDINMRFLIARPGDYRAWRDWQYASCDYTTPISGQLVNAS